MTYNQTAYISSDLFQCDYAVGYTTDGQAVYVWSNIDVDEYTQDMLERPGCFHGALVGSIDEVKWEIENCVGGFRYHGNEEQQEESAEIVETLLAGLK